MAYGIARARPGSVRDRSHHQPPVLTDHEPPPWESRRGHHIGKLNVTVLIAHEIDNPALRKSIEPASNFGEFRYANKFYIHGDELERSGNDNLIPTGYRVNMERVAEAFNPDVDYLLIAGDHLQLLALTAILIGRHGYLTVLRWDRNMSEYIPVRLSSGIVPPAQPVLVSGTHIGEIDAEIRRNAQAVATESPWTGGLDEARRRSRRKPS